MLLEQITKETTPQTLVKSAHNSTHTRPSAHVPRYLAFYAIYTVVDCVVYTQFSSVSSFYTQC